MKLYVGVTDKDWYEFLAQMPREEVNFWSPSGSTTFKVLQPNELFLFKLHSPQNYIVGGGFFVSHSKLPFSLAWDAFGINNGAPDLDTCLSRVRKYRKTDEPDPVIGCNILASPFFFPVQEWIPVPPSFKLNIVQGKGYSTEEGDGQTLLAQVWDLLQRTIPVDVRNEAPTMIYEGAKHGVPYLTRPRLGQGAFRVLVTDAYSRRCALTGERTLPVLDAAHIRPYACDGPHDPQNGLLMRTDLHKLFDRGYITVRPNLTIDVSPRIHKEFSNGQIYYALQDQPLAVVPLKKSEQPSPDFLRWHNQEIFRV